MHCKSRLADAMALTHDGRLFGWGSNAFGQCGIGDDDIRPVPAPRYIGRLSGKPVAAAPPATKRVGGGFVRHTVGERR